MAPVLKSPLEKLLENSILCIMYKNTDLRKSRVRTSFIYCHDFNRKFFETFKLSFQTLKWDQNMVP